MSRRCGAGRQVGQQVRAGRSGDIPTNPFTAGVYVATMMATVYVLRQKVPPWRLDLRPPPPVTRTRPAPAPAPSTHARVARPCLWSRNNNIHSCR